MTALAIRGHGLRVDVVAALHLVGLIVAVVSVTLVAPLLLALWDGDSVAPFVVGIATGLAAGGGLAWATRGARTVGPTEGVLVVALAWLAAALIGAIPYIVHGGQVGRVPDALFEAMSGFTTTGASVMTDIEAHQRPLLLWRSMTEWLGGMGIVVLAIAILPRVSGRALLENESPGPGYEKLSPRIRGTAGRLWLLYVGFTMVEVVALWIGGLAGWSPGMDLYNSVCHAMTTMATGGFSTDGRSLEGFGAYAQWVVMLFMVVAGVSFVLWFRCLFRSPRWIRRDDEFRFYVLTVLVVGLVVGGELWFRSIHGFADSLRHGLFQSASLVTGTGYASDDFALWGAPLAQFLLVLAMFSGGCAGSTTGSIKIARHLLVWRLLRREVRTSARPGLVRPIRLAGAPVDEVLVRTVTVFIVIYVLIFLVGTTTILLDSAVVELDLTPFEAIAASAATLGNVGPSVGAAGPMGSYAQFGDASTMTMLVLMWVGRLELLPVLILASRSYWQR